MTQENTRDLSEFLPYMLNMAAEDVGLEFARFYKGRYGMLRTEWRVLFHLGQFGPMTAKQIVERAKSHKTKISRAVAALESKRFVKRSEDDDDRRHAWLELTPAGRVAFDDLWQQAWQYEAKLMDRFSAEEIAVLRGCLKKLMN